MFGAIICHKFSELIITPSMAHSVRVILGDLTTSDLAMETGPDEMSKIIWLSPEKVE